MPSSPAPNRERVERFTWNRHYFHDPTRLARGRAQLTVLALVVAGGWLALGWALPEEERQNRYSHGPVASPHAAWDQRCDACHTSSSVDQLSFANLPDVHARWNNFRCETCHPGPASEPKNFAPHHAEAVWKDGSATDCGRCHREHQGRNVSLVKLPDSDCTQCHKDLKAHHIRGEPAYLSSIARFENGKSDSHPEFRAVAAGREIKRTLRFNHAQHMMPGLNGPGSAKLECASCHQLAGNQPGRIDGAYMLPVKFENHCQTCHPIETGPLALRGTTVDVKSIKLPHRLQSEPLNEQLRQGIISELARAKIVAPDSPEKKGRDRLDPLVDEQLAKLKSYNDVVDKLAIQARKQLALGNALGGTTCGKCHLMEPGSEKALTVEKPSSLAIWFPHAKFNHASHKAMNCAACHPGKFENGTDDRGVLRLDWLAKTESLDLPGIDNCRQCHAPASRLKIDGKFEPRGGVRHGCVDCHRYHNDEVPGWNGIDTMLRGHAREVTK